MTASLAYRKNEAAILRGDVPEKYLRVLPHIPGKSVLEIGSAEGVLALLMARQGMTVTALERSSERHETALGLCQHWAGLDSFAAPAFVNGDIADRPDLLDGVDTLVAVRVIYYLGTGLDPLFAAAAEKVRNIVLSGNKNRAARHFAGTSDGKADDYYASADGMVDVLTRHGYTAEVIEPDGDPIVVGRRDA